MNVICTLDHKQLYEKANKEGIQFFQWHKWLEETLNKEFLRQMIHGNKPKPAVEVKKKEEEKKKAKPRKSLMKEAPKTSKAGKTIKFEVDSEGEEEAPRDLKSRMMKGLGKMFNK